MLNVIKIFAFIDFRGNNSNYLLICDVINVLRAIASGLQKCMEVLPSAQAAIKDEVSKFRKKRIPA